MANKSKAVTDLKTVEFMMDFPTEFTVTNVYKENDSVVFEFETDLDVPEQVKLQYQADEYGNIALVGLE